MQVVGGVDACFGRGRGGCGFGVGHVRAILPVGGWRASGNGSYRGFARIGLVGVGRGSRTSSGVFRDEEVDGRDQVGTVGDCKRSRALLLCEE